MKSGALACCALRRQRSVSLSMLRRRAHVAASYTPHRLPPARRREPSPHIISHLRVVVSLLRTSPSRCFSSSSPSSPPSPPPPVPPFLPPSLSATLDSLRSFPEIHTALTSLPSSPNLALAPLHRALEVFTRIPNDPLSLLLTLRLLSTSLHLHPHPPPSSEAATHLHLLTHSLSIPLSSHPDALLLHAQAAFSYLTLPPPLQSPHGTDRARQAVHALTRGGEDGRLRANAMVLEAATAAPPSPRTADVYREALELLSIPATSVSSSPLSLYLDRLLTPADVQLLLADLVAQASSPSPSLSSLPPSVASQYEAAVSAYETLPSPALPLATGGRQLPLAYALTALSRSSAALSLTETLLSSSHPFMATVLRWAAAQQQSEGEAIVAEGLLRASIGRLEKEADGSRGARERKEELLRSRWSYAQLLDKLEWNERSRKAEGDHWRAKAEEVVGQDATLQAVLAELKAGQRSRGAPLIAQWMVQRFSI